MSPSSELIERRRRQILEAASRVFVRAGFKDASMDDIVTEAGLSKGGLYWYFNSKEELITALLDNFFDQELVHVRASLEGDSPAHEKLLRFSDLMIEELKRMQPFMPILLEFISLAARKQSVLQRLNRYFHNYLGIVTPIIQEGIEAGEFRPVGAQKAAVAVGAILEGTILLWVYDPQTVNFEEYIASNMRLLLSGLQAEA